MGRRGRWRVVHRTAATTVPPVLYEPWWRTLPLMVLVAASGGMIATAPDRVMLRLAGWAGIASMATLSTILLRRITLEHRRTVRRLEVLASTDTLTGLANRRLFLDRLAVCIDASGAGHSTAVVLADLDLFKRVNDEFGHDVGDEVLMAVARELAAGCRNDDVAARLGGEEFALLLRGAGLTDAVRVAEAVGAAVRSCAQVPVTISCGVTTVRPYDDARSVLQRADAAMYEAKRLGRDRVVSSADAGRHGNRQAS